jgi:hypothetical protein
VTPPSIRYSPRLTARATGLILLVLALTLLAVPLSAGVAVAQSTVSTDVGVRAWVTNGYTKFSFADAAISPRSELRWRGTDFVMGEARADMVWRKLVLRLSVGGGRPDDGVLLDDDYDVTDRQERFSHTRSIVDGSHAFYANGDVGYRVHQWHEPMSGTRGFVDVFVGYQYWEEEYEAFGFTGVEGVPPFEPVLPQSLPNSTKGITEKYSFHSARIGARAVVPLGAGFAWRVDGAWFPYTRSELVDIHHLRPDLRQDPSGRATAYGGFGYQLDSAVTYDVWRGLSVEAGYRFWRLDSGTGRLTLFNSDGTAARVRLNEIIIERSGPYVGLQYRF